MTVMQERAFEMIKRLPDEKIYYIVQIYVLYTQKKYAGCFSENNTI